MLSSARPRRAFVQKYRERFSRIRRLVLTVVEERLVNRAGLTENDVVVPVRNDFVAVFDNILQVLPDTKTIAVVIGASPLEKFWLDELKRELKPLEGPGRPRLVRRPVVEEILKRASALPPHTVLFWGLMSVDGAGIAHEGDLALRSLHAVANAPIFSYQEAFLRRRNRRRPDALDRPKPVGRPSTRRCESSGARSRTASRYEPIGFGPPKYDWRELQRWGISESNLPPGSEILFREPAVWERYRWQMLLITASFLVQAGLISGLAARASPPARWPRSSCANVWPSSRTSIAIRPSAS